MVVAFVKGLQGDDPKYWLSAALLKHFLANSNENHRTSSSSDFDERLFWEYYSVPFRMGFLEGGAKGVMASYNSWNGTPMSVNPILKSVLERQWGVEILSGDGGAIKLLTTAHKRYPDMDTAVAAAAGAGINQFLDNVKTEAAADVKNGSITEKELDDLLRLKFRTTIRLGLLDPPGMVPYASIKDYPEPWDSAKDMGISEKVALESVVLLKNDPVKTSSPLLPLNKQQIKSIAVIGPLADSVHWDWYGGTAPHLVTPLEGIRTAVGPGVTVNYAADETGQAAYTAAHSSDVAVVFVGNDPTCGPDMARDWKDTIDGGGTLACSDPGDGREGRDRDSIDLYQEQLIKQVYAANPRTIVVLISSFPFAINWTQANVPAILHMAHSSQDEGTALAKVLFGDFNPAGRTVTTWPRSLDQLPPMMDYNIRHGRTYMYFKGDPLYPFGFGLSYTTFSFANLKTNSPVLAASGTLNVSVDVTNTGPVAGDEVVQLYVHHRNSKVERPKQELKAFQRVAIPPGETRTVQLALKASTLAYWNQQQARLEVERDSLEVMVGDSSQAIKLRSTVAVQ
jgi:beta-glucosidase